MGVEPKLGGTPKPPKWMVKIRVGKAYEQMDDLMRIHYFWKHPYIWSNYSDLTRPHPKR